MSRCTCINFSFSVLHGYLYFCSMDEKLFNAPFHFVWQPILTSFVAVENRENQGTWRERLQWWNEIIRKDKLAEQLDSIKAQYVVEFDMKEVEKSLRKDITEKGIDNQWPRALWISKRWWRYRPKLPYVYFLQKLASSEVIFLVVNPFLSMSLMLFCGLENLALCT